MMDSEPRWDGWATRFSLKSQRQTIANSVGTRTEQKSGGSIRSPQIEIQPATADVKLAGRTPETDFAISRVVLTPSTKGMSSTRPPQARTC